MRLARTLVAAVIVTFALPLAINAECPCVPVTHLWIVKTCDSWDCAASDLAVANGDPHVFAVPYGMDDQRWIVFSLIPSGSSAETYNDPLQIDTFEGMDGASAHFVTIDAARHPIIVSAPDGHFLVVSLKHADPRRRSASVH